jgi:hypothetical protein
VGSFIILSPTHPTAHTEGGRAAGSDKQQMGVNVTGRFYPEDDAGVYLRNVATCLPNLMASHLRHRDPNILRILRTSNLTSAFVFITLKYNGGNQHLKDSVLHLPGP